MHNTTTPDPAGHRPSHRSGHLVQRIDALPPWAPPAGRRYWCPTCGYLTHTEVKNTPEIHEITGPEEWIAPDDLQPENGSRGWC